MKKSKIIIIVILLLAVCLFNTNVMAETEIKYGDVNGDGTVNETDTVLIDKYIAGTTELDYDSQIRADVDKDNKISRNDSKMIRNYILGKIDLPVLMGDVNEDGNVTIDDISMLQQGMNEMVTLTESQQLKADVNVDDTLSMNDVTAIQRHINNNIASPLPTIEGKPIVKPAEDKQTDKTDDSTKEKNPETGSKLYLYVIAFLLVSGTALTVTYKYNKKLNK